MSAPEPDVAAPPEPAARTGKVRLTFVLLGVLLAGSAAVVAVVGAQVLSDALAQREQAAALAAARAGVATVFSYDPRDVDTDLANARRVVSGSFSADFEELAATVIKPAAAQGLSTQAEVSRAATVDSQPEQLRALLLVRQTTRGPSLPQPRIRTDSVQVRMTKVAGSWLISGMQPL